VHRQFNDWYRNSFIINVHYRPYIFQGWIILNFFTDRMLFLMPNQQCQSTEVHQKRNRGPIHRHYPKIHSKTCHKIILWQKLRCHKMILRHISSKLTKFVLGDRKMTRYHGNYDVCLRLCICYGHPYPFYPFVPVPARTCTSIRPSAQHFHNTAINVSSSRWQPLGSAD